MKFFYILFGAILISLLIVGVFFYYRVDPSLLTASKTDWASVFMAFAAILIAILLIFNFIYVKQIMDISEETKISVKSIPKLEKKIIALESRIISLESSKINKTLDVCLENLFSEEKEQIIISAQTFGELGNNIHLDALNHALRKETDKDVIKAIANAIGKIEERERVHSLN